MFFEASDFHQPSPSFFIEKCTHVVVSIAASLMCLPSKSVQEQQQAKKIDSPLASSMCHVLYSKWKISSFTGEAGVKLLFSDAKMQQSSSHGTGSAAWQNVQTISIFIADDDEAGGIELMLLQLVVTPTISFLPKTLVYANQLPYFASANPI